MARPPAKKLPTALLALMVVGAMVFAATGSFVIAPWLFPRKPGEFSVASVLIAGVMGAFGAAVGIGLGSRLLAKK